MYKRQELLLENGAEIFRVEETMDRICRHYGVESASQFILMNYILATAGEGHGHVFAKVRHIPVNGSHLDKVAAVNQLSSCLLYTSYIQPFSDFDLLTVRFHTFLCLKNVFDTSVLIQSSQWEQTAEPRSDFMDTTSACLLYPSPITL